MIEIDEKRLKQRITFEVFCQTSISTGIFKKVKKDEVYATGNFPVSPSPLRNFHRS